MANVLNNLSYGDSSVIQFLDDGTFVFRPKHNASVAGIEVVGYMQFDQQAAPAVAPSGSARLYFDTGSQTIQQSIAGGGFANLVGAVTSITQGGGTVSVSAAGAITATVAAAQALTLNGAASSSIVLSTTGAITTTAASGTATTINGGGAGTNQLLIGTDGTVSLTASSGKALTLTGDTGTTLTLTAGGAINCNPNNNFNVTAGAGGSIVLTGVNSSNITFNSAGAIAIVGASAQNVAVTTSGGGLFTVNGQTVPTAVVTPNYLMMPFNVSAPYTGVATGAATGTANTVFCLRFILAFPITITQLVASISANIAATHLGIAIYNSALAVTGVTATFSGAAAGVVTAAITSTTLQPGLYYYCWSMDSASLGPVTIAPTETAILNGGNNPDLFTSTTTSVAGVMPATISFSASSTQAIPLCKLNG